MRTKKPRKERRLNRRLFAKYANEACAIINRKDKIGHQPGDWEKLMTIFDQCQLRRTDKLVMASSFVTGLE